ncbi:hypothetical protein E2562_001261 [Oryza meyeriana var. granulata]|uniref:Uncharacterized protein n=1 Tax=Oryza meyeriana var. granulata TaxID=110450 RepID=A0A6G1DCB3_9ORYZ|nr:hypothetical protein E2562_001261 [Oryza meyeriana var. granulata]
MLQALRVSRFASLQAGTRAPRGPAPKNGDIPKSGGELRRRGVDQAAPGEAIGGAGVAGEGCAGAREESSRHRGKPAAELAAPGRAAPRRPATGRATPAPGSRAIGGAGCTEEACVGEGYAGSAGTGSRGRVAPAQGGEQAAPGRAAGLRRISQHREQWEASSERPAVVQALRASSAASRTAWSRSRRC